MYASILVVAAEPFVLYRESGCPNYIELSGIAGTIWLGGDKV